MTPIDLCWVLKLKENFYIALIYVLHSSNRFVLGSKINRKFLHNSVLRFTWLKLICAGFKILIENSYIALIYVLHCFKN